MVNQVVEESFPCNLNPKSEKYILKVIGDQQVTFNSNKQKYIVTGEYPNVSDFIRIEMSSESYGNGSIPLTSSDQQDQNPGRLRDMLQQDQSQQPLSLEQELLMLLKAMMDIFMVDMHKQGGLTIV